MREIYALTALGMLFVALGISIWYRHEKKQIEQHRDELKRKLREALDKHE